MHAGTSPIPFVREHKPVAEDIDETYNAVIYSASEMRTYLLHPKGMGGNQNEIFIAFYRPFYGLFLHTRYNAPLKGDEAFQDLVDRIDRWFEYEGKVTVVYMKAGLRLFGEYQRRILQGAVISAQRG